LVAVDLVVVQVLTLAVDPDYQAVVTLGAVAVTVEPWDAVTMARIHAVVGAVVVSSPRDNAEPKMHY
jgi:hypothetical protein